MLEEVQRQGAQAARKGLTVWDCPYLRADAMPAHSGESFLKWEQKVRVWENGWHKVKSGRAEERGALAAAWIRALKAHHRGDSTLPKSDLFCSAVTLEAHASVVEEPQSQRPKPHVR
ncbi:hypothetical protein D3C87_912670 [compost metagenome]